MSPIFGNSGYCGVRVAAKSKHLVAGACFTSLLTIDLFAKGAWKRKHALSRENEAYLNKMKESIEACETIRMGSNMDLFFGIKT